MSTTIAGMSTTAGPYASKRLIDLLLLTVVAVPAGVVGALCGLAIRLTSPGPILYRQTRVGMSEQPFEMIKFRTMVDRPDNPLIPDDDRITRIGRVLRRFSIDELPQLLNVARGEMSLVGPRPPLEVQVAEFTARQRERFAVRPGLTGLAQLSGRNELTWGERIEFDLDYVDRQSPGLDLALAVRTPMALLLGSGVDGHPEDDPVLNPGSAERDLD